MITFTIGLIILFFGYIFYSKYVVKQFAPDNRETPAIKLADGVDFTEMSPFRTRLLQLLNIAGMGPILGAIQGILFGAIAFILIPLGCVFFGAVHDYFAGMVSVRNDGMQITELIKKYLGKRVYNVTLFVICVMLLLLSIVFVYTTGDIIALDFLKQQDLSLSNVYILTIYSIIILYYILASFLPIDKFIGRIYPIFALILLFGTALIFIGFFTHQTSFYELDFSNINLHPNNLPILPVFFITVSCGLLSGFHATLGH